MLVLTRHLNRSIVINSTSLGGMKVFVVEGRGDRVCLGVATPKDVPAHRKEVYQQVQQKNEAAIKTPASTIGKTLDEMRRAKSLPK